MPGDPKKPARIVQITMGETDGKMIFTPEKIQVKKGEQVKFMLRNNGELDHEFILRHWCNGCLHGFQQQMVFSFAHRTLRGSRGDGRRTVLFPD